MVESLALDKFNFVRVRIILSFRRSEEPVHPVADGRVDGNVFQKLETGESQTEIMRHSVLHAVRNVHVLEFGGLEIDFVLKGCVITY